MLGANAAALYNFDLDALAPHSAHGPLVSQVTEGLGQIPNSTSLAFEPRATGVA